MGAGEGGVRLSATELSGGEVCKGLEDSIALNKEIVLGEGRRAGCLLH